MPHQRRESLAPCPATLATRVPNRPLPYYRRKSVAILPHQRRESLTPFPCHTSDESPWETPATSATRVPDPLPH
ncbi:hypothetical protein BDZ85DRAFT_266250 [Elsinoe ampelina]|uniref:Uncharacterized protein n=1 Tax=Elsinoe ampelina TaxID=302913 RepID=A0A6A6G5V3_9PEZI|nr:hypothetical protein BDZ85DRAFT_266250 [Elsinoe ampelina]